jgi:hypothetical protein
MRRFYEATIKGLQNKSFHDLAGVLFVDNKPVLRRRMGF